MQHITYRPVDRQFRCVQADLPEGAPFNRVDPIPGITFGFALASRYPNEVFYGTVNGSVADEPAIGLHAVTKEAYEAAQAAEREATEPKIVIPAVVTMRQAKLALRRAGLIAKANTAIAALTGGEGEEAQIEWEYASELRRDHPLVTGLGLQLGLDDAAIDALFIAASQIS